MRNFMPNSRPAFIDHFIKLLFPYKQNFTGYTKVAAAGAKLCGSHRLIRKPNTQFVRLIQPVRLFENIALLAHPAHNYTAG